MQVGMGNRAAIYLPFPQAVPAKYTIDPERCLFLTRENAGNHLCVDACAPGAIDFEQKDEIVEFKVGAIIVATGFDVFDASRKPEFGYNDYENVITSLELERLVAASGPQKVI